MCNIRDYRLLQGGTSQQSIQSSTKYQSKEDGTQNHIIQYGTKPQSIQDGTKHQSIQDGTKHQRKWEEFECVSGVMTDRQIQAPLKSFKSTGKSIIDFILKFNLIYLTPSSEENCANKFVGSPITTLVTPRICVKPKLNQTSSNLRKIPRTIYSNTFNKLFLISLNVRSVKNKSTSICDFMQSNNADLLALTETWLGSAIDKSVISETTPDGYQIFHIPRENKLGGGVALIQYRCKTF
ncbi:Hypothetical predicted protein [Mytilus galloprovincialis]|uniref:Endonuclease/exonuclease/phosphatase domain-containing protein n=1 Tax=Mytilus galloprovincialis TaxID=29158 RepID=A0A8B6GWU2_MYTGA|nr:Hypothetical predicted protein [Mytilus galloprovincialis]